MNKKIGRSAQERRRYQRYSASNLSVTLQAAKDATTNESLAIVDFNRYGLALYSHSSFKVGDTLNLTLSDASGHHIDILGFVCNRAPANEGFRCGLRFIETHSSGESSPPGAAKATTLLEMEQTLESLAS